MARRGTFGRLPRAVPSLTNTIIAIAREMIAAEDRNIMDAWQNGGLYQGKPVTDEMILKHWQERTQGLDKSDPQYDTYHNNYMQADYSIHEGRQAVLYKQGKINETQMAQFYLNWAKKVPKDSAFYRTLQTDAANFLQAAAAKGRAGAAKAKRDAYNAFQSDVSKRYLALGDTLTGLMTNIARANNLIGQDEDLTKFMLQGENDPGRMEHLLTLITGDMKSNPTQYAAVISAIKAADPSWDGNLTSAYFGRALQGQIKGYALIRDRATKDGYTTNAKAASKAIGSVNALGTEVQSWPIAAAYSVAREEFDKVWNSPAATDADKGVAAERFAAAIDGFSKRNGLDPAMANRLANDAMALRGDPTAANQSSFFENYLGLHGTTAGTVATGSTTSAGGAVKGENAKFAQDMARIDFWKQQYDLNPAAYVYASYKLDAQGNQVYDGTGAGPIGVVPLTSVASSPNANTIIPVPTITGGAIMQVVTQQPVVVDDPHNPSVHTVVGTSITYYAGGTPITLYGVQRPNQTTDWTPVAPWANNVSETRKPDGIHLTVNVVSDPAAQAAQLDAENKTNIAASFTSGQVPADGTKWTVKGPATTDGSRTDKTVTWKNGQFLTGQTSVALTGGKETGRVESPLTPFQPPDLLNMVWDQSRLKADPNPAIDLQTPIMAALVAGKEMGDAVVSSWTNPQFQAQLQQQEVLVSGGDPIKLQQLAANNQSIVRNLAGYGPSAKFGMYEFKAAAKDRRDLIMPSLNVQATANQRPQIKTAGDITVPQLPWGSFGTPGFEAGVPGSPYAGPPTPARPIIPSRPGVAPTPQQQPIPTQPATTVAAVPTPTPTPGVSGSGILLPQLRPYSPTGSNIGMPAPLPAPAYQSVPGQKAPLK